MVGNTKARTAHHILAVTPSAEFIEVVCWLIRAITTKDTFVGVAVSDISAIIGEVLATTGVRALTCSLGKVKLGVAKSGDVDNSASVDFVKDTG